MNNLLEQKISSNNKIVIEPINPNFNANSAVCAINWFDLKIAWLYKLYTLLASKIVKNVSGQLYFKGNLHSKIEGSELEQRENLLIVCYATPMQFLKLVKIKLFQLISVLRIAAVKQFCFGFSENLIDKSQVNNDFKKQQLYLVHHFQGKPSWLKENLPALENIAFQYQSEVFFCGLTSARLAREKSGKIHAADFFMDGMIIFSSDNHENFEPLMENEIYKIFKRQNAVNGLYLFSRIY